MNGELEICQGSHLRSRARQQWTQTVRAIAEFILTG